MPEWVKPLLEGKDVAAELAKETEDPYLNYLKRRQDSFPCASWETTLKKTFSAIPLRSSHVL